MSIIVWLSVCILVTVHISVAVKIYTLELRGDAVYGQSFDMVCFTNVNVSVPYATFYRSLSLSSVNIIVATVVYDLSLNSCNVTPSGFKNYTYSCSNEGKNITLTVPAENEVEHNTFWVCANQGAFDKTNNNLIAVYVHDPVLNVAIRNNTVVNVIEGISETFVCETSPCRPSADIYWMKNGINITNPQASSSIHQSGTKSITSSTLQFTAVRGDSGSLLACGAYNGYGTRKLSADIIIIVHYAPDGSPSISGYSNSSVIKVIEKMSYSLICSITGGNPLASLSWNCFGIAGSSGTVAQTVTSTISLNVERNRTDSPAVNPFTSPLKVIQGQPLVVVCSVDGNPSPQLTWNPAGEDRVNRSRLYYSAISRDNAVIHTCTATNNMVPTSGNPQLGSDSKELLIDVLYSPTVDTFTLPVKAIQGQPLVVVCSADGNPSPQLTWNPAGEDKVNKSRLYYLAISRDKGVIHTCTATNNMVPTIGSPQLGSDFNELVIDVLYSPTINPFTSPFKVIQGQPLVVVCSVGGNPSPQVTWNPAGEDRVNRSRLYYSAISRDNAVIHTCTATNNMVPTTGNPQLGSDSKELFIDVLYSPIVNPNTLSVEVREGQPLVVVCNADGNPSPQLTWNPAGEDTVNSTRLYYSAISRDKAVIHTCTATNIMVPTTGSPQLGSDLKELVIDVLYNASIYMFSSKDNISVLNENSSLQLLCQVDSNPYAVISLYFENYLKLKVEDAQNLSYTKTAVCLDAGKYTCSARNKIMNGDAVSRNIQINVACYPRLDTRRNVSTEYYGALGDNVTLEVYLIAYPEPENIAWYHRERETDMWQMFPYQSPSSTGLYANIMVHLASERNFGYYKVNMSNDFGIYNRIYHILPGSTPGVPINFTVTVIGPDSVKLEWTPGFWGGHSQYFIIQYRVLPDGAWMKYDQIRDSGSMKQTVTIIGLQQKTIYEFHLHAENIVGASNITSAIMTTTELSTYESPETSVTGLAGGISAGLVVILVVGIGMFLWRRYQHAKQNEHVTDKDIKMEHKDSARKNQVKATCDKQDADYGREYEGLHFTDTEANQYLQLGGIASENNRNADKRSPESDSYEQLHPYANNDIQMYSALKIPKTSQDSQKDYENTWIKD